MAGRALLLLIAVLAVTPRPALGQRFGGDYGAAFGLWIVFGDPGLDAERSFDRDLGPVAAVGGRIFFQTGRARLGLGGFTGGFVSDGPNEDDPPRQVQGGLTTGGFIAEYLVVQRNLEVALGGMLGPGRLSVEKVLVPADDDGVENLDRYRNTILVGYPWARVGYNPKPFVNVGLELGYLVGGEGIGGFASSIELMLGLIP